MSRASDRADTPAVGRAGELAGGWTAEVTKVGELRYRAKILGRQGVVYGTLEANQHDAGLDANGVYIVLSAGGVISAHL